MAGPSGGRKPFFRRRKTCPFSGEKAPKIFYVNWFRKSEEGKFLWPGFGENSRVLKWMCERVEGKAEAIDTPIGRIPTKDGLDLDGLDIDEGVMEGLLKGDRAPEGMKAQVEALKKRLG